MHRTVMFVAALGLTGLATVLVAAQPAAAALPATQLYYPEIVSPGQGFSVRLHYAKPNGGDLTFDCATQHATGYWDGNQVASITPTNSGHACDATYLVTSAKLTTVGSHTVRVAVEGGPALSGPITVKGAATTRPTPRPTRTTPEPAVASSDASALIPPSPADVSPSVTDGSPAAEASPSTQVVAASVGDGLRRDAGYFAAALGLAVVLTGVGVVLVRRYSQRTQPVDGADDFDVLP